MFLSLEALHKFSTYTMLKETRYSKVELETLEGIPVAVKKYHGNKCEQYERERDILLELNGKFRTPRLLSYNDEAMTLYIEWIAGDRLKEYMIQHYLGIHSAEAYHETDTIKKAQELFKSDESPKVMNIKTQVFSIVRLLHRYGVLHGDLSTRNFIVTPEGLVNIIDFSDGKFARRDFSSAKHIYADRLYLKQNFGIHWKTFKRLNYPYLKKEYYQSCIYPNGFITSGDGQGSTNRKFSYLGIKSLKGRNFLDVGCAEGEICRYAYKKGACQVLGIDINDRTLVRGKEINNLYGYRSIKLRKGDVRHLSESTGSNKYDIVTCFSLLHHLLADKENLDMLEVVTNPKQAKIRKSLIKYINELLSVTNQILFLELPFLYLRVSDRTLETGIRFCECIAPDIRGIIYPLGIWHANNKKARFIFRINKLGFEATNDLMLSNPVLEAWHRNIPIVAPVALRSHLPLNIAASIKRLAFRGKTFINHFRPF